MPIVVTDYDPQWNAIFDDLRIRIWPEIQPFAMSIEHVGSTSVEGLAAKPVIDMTIVLANVDRLPPIIARLNGIGYQHRGDLGVTGREAFAQPADAPPHHLYACVKGCVALRNHLAVRDRLRRDPQAVAAYSKLKKQLAQRFPGDIDAYVDGKTPFILALLQEEGFDCEELDAVNAINALPHRDNPTGGGR